MLIFNTSKNPSVQITKLVAWLTLFTTFFFCFNHAIFFFPDWLNKLILYDLLEKKTFFLVYLVDLFSCVNFAFFIFLLSITSKKQFLKLSIRHKLCKCIFFLSNPSENPPFITHYLKFKMRSYNLCNIK